jgi:dTDP-L-rhamnose 4-epimerase
MSLYGEGQYACGACGPVAPPLRPLPQLQARDWEMRCPRCREHVSPRPTAETKPLLPTSVYAVSKRDQEELCLCVGRSYGIPTVALRYFNVYGPRQALSNPYTGVCAIFSARIKNERRPLVFEDGQQTRDFTHVRDIVRANLFVMAEPRADHGTFNVGTGRAVAISEIGRLLAKLYEVPVEPELTQKYRAGDIRHCVADPGALAALGFRPSVSLEEGLRDLVEWGRTVPAEDRVEQAARELEARGLTRG